MCLLAFPNVNTAPSVMAGNAESGRAVLATRILPFSSGVVGHNVSVPEKSISYPLNEGIQKARPLLLCKGKASSSVRYSGGSSENFTGCACSSLTGWDQSCTSPASAEQKTRGFSPGTWGFLRPAPAKNWLTREM